VLTFYFVRHGQTALSRANQFCGDLDVPLNDVGRAMAEALAARYGGEPWASIYASPRQRTRATAEPVARRAGLEVEILDGLREISYGEWEGRAEEEVARDDAERFRAWADDPALHAPPGGESAGQIAARALDAIAHIRARHADGQVLVVSHKATLRVLLCALLGIELSQFRNRIGQRVAAVSVVEWKQTGPLLRSLGDVSHLPPELLVGDGT
jgi:probable phosphoglycerate mutase